MPSIADVPAFTAESDSGNMAFLAAQAALSVLKLPVSIAHLAGASGDVFKFMYDNAPVYEPLRDLRPVDTLARAFNAVGLRAEWVPDATLDHVRGQVEAHAEIGQPVLTSGLPGLDGAFALLVGYDEDTDTLTYRGPAHAGAAEGSDAYATLSLTNNPAWDGPVTGAPHWVDFPLLVVRGPLYNPPDETTQRRSALELALGMQRGDPLEYPDHPGAQARADIPLAPRKVRQGLAALALFADDLATLDMSHPASLWRLEATLRGLAWDRSLAIHYLESWEADAPAALMGHYRTVAHTARTLLTRTWERRSTAARSIEELHALVGSTAALVYAIPPTLVDSLQHTDLGQILEMARGPALLVDSPRRREGVVALAERLHDHEITCETLIKTALSAL